MMLSSWVMVSRLTVGVHDTHTSLSSRFRVDVCAATCDPNSDTLRVLFSKSKEFFARTYWYSDVC